MSVAHASCISIHRLRWVRLLLSIAGGACVVVALGAGLIVADEHFFRPRGTIEFRPAIHQVPSPLIAGVENPITVTISNGTRRPVRLLGATNACGPSGCAAVTGLPMDVPPRSERSLHVLYRPPSAGPFSYDGPVYTDRPEQPVLTLRIDGVAVEATKH